MDVFGGLLDGPRARGAFTLRVMMDPPWSVRIEDQAPLSLVSVARGHAWVIPGDEAPVRLGPGSVAVMRGPDPYAFADDPATPAQVVIHPGQRCTTPDGQDLAQAMHLGVRTWGNSPVGASSMLVGTYERQGEIGGQLLSVLPRLVVMPAQEWDSSCAPDLTSTHWFFRAGPHGWIVIVSSRTVGCTRVHQVEPQFPSKLCASLPQSPRTRTSPQNGRLLRTNGNN